MFHVQFVPKGPIQLQPVTFPTATTTSKIPPTSDAVQKTTSESFTLKKESLSSLSTSEDIETGESLPSFVTHANNPTTSSSDPSYARNDSADLGDVQIFMFRNVKFIFRAYLLLGSGGVVYFYF